MSFNGSEGRAIEVATGAAYTANYRAEHPDGIKGTFFGKNILQQILNQPGCVGIRFYYGLTATGAPKLVIVGADTNENDMITGRIVADESVDSPPHGGVNNQLNS